MEKYISLLGALLLFAATLGATSIEPSNPTSGSANILQCQLDPPQDFQLLYVAVNSAKYKWTPLVNFKHRIVTRRTSDNSVLNDTIMPVGATEVTIENLPSETECYATINAICEDGNDSGKKSIIYFKTVILDLIAVGFQPGGAPNCTINQAGQSCLFPADGTLCPFKVKLGLLTRQFAIKYNTSTWHFEVCIGPDGNTNQAIKFYCAEFQSPNCYGTTKIWVTYVVSNLEFRMATFTATSQGPSSPALFNLTAANWGVSFETPYNETLFNHSDDLRDQAQIVSLAGANVSCTPNPFADVLNVSLELPITNDASISLLRTDGQIIGNGRIAAGQTHYTFETATLPAGFYLLRVQSGDQVQVLKVVKSE